MQYIPKAVILQILSDFTFLFQQTYANFSLFCKLERQTCINMVNACYISKQDYLFCKKDEQRRQFLLDSRAMRQQIKTGMSGEFELS